MGIHNFHKWLNNTYKDIYIPIEGNNIYDFVYIDVNFLLHNCIYSSSNENEFIKKLYNQFDLILSNFIASKEIFFSLDGVAPQAKIYLQKKRRQNMGNSSKGSKEGFNSLLLTPGTTFMEKLHKYIKIYLSKLKKRYLYINPTLNFSTSNEPNEGEIKINQRLLQNGRKSLNSKHLIIGNDADIVILSMAAIGINHINILFKNKKKNQLISISKLIELIKIHINNQEKKEKNIREEFVIISLLMGNDYLPKLGYINIEKLWKSYFETVYIYPTMNIIKKGQLDFIFLEKLLLNIYKNLSNSFKKISNITYNPNKFKSYLEGILWCFTMYKTGKCPNYDYSYKYKKIIHPYELLFFCCSNDNNIKVHISEKKPLSPYDYAALVLPKCSLHLIAN